MCCGAQRGTASCASADGNIYLYNNDDYAIKGRCGGHLTLAEEASSSQGGGGKTTESKAEGTKEEGAGGHSGGSGCYPLKIDFDANGQWLRSSDNQYRLVYHSAATGEHQRNGFKELKNVNFATQRTTIGWGVRGIWPVSDDGTIITSSCLSHSEVSNDQQTLCTTDNMGRLRVYHYPVPPPTTETSTIGGVDALVTTAESAPLEFRAHVGPCANVCSSYNDATMVCFLFF